MRVRDRVLAILEENRGQYLSGEALAARLFVSRAAVWKAVRALRDEGYEILASTNRGYSLSSGSEILSQQSIEKYLPRDDFPFAIQVHRCVGSTNDIVKALAAQGFQEGAVAVAERQSAGRGRRGRPFFSPEGTGVYFSVLLRPSLSAREAVYITTAAAVAAASAIESVSGREARIKWVNDIFLGDRKVAGILTEASLDMESGALEYAVLGIGINVLPPILGFPAEIQGVAAAVFEGETPPPDCRSRLVAETLKNFFRSYRSLAKRPFLDEYRARSMVLGRDVLVLRGERSERAAALSILDDCSLLVRFSDGREEALSSGEVSIAPIGVSPAD